MVCRPASQFCCGCSVKSGVIFILCLNLLESLWITIMTGVFVIGKSTMMAGYALFADIGHQVLLACFALAGIPIILVALWGVFHGNEVCVRVYLYYMILTFLLDIAYISSHFLFHHTCDDLPYIMAEQGRAWACGMTRVIDATSFLLLLVIPAYLIFVVFSYCEDMAEGGSGPDLSDLVLNIGKHKKQTPINDPYSSVLGGAGYTGGAYGSTYEEHIAHGLGGGQNILDGHYHEMEYPPPVAAVSHWKK